MPLLTPITPKALYDAFIRAGYKQIDEGQHNWVVAKGDGDKPMIIPKNGKLVSVPIMSEAQARGVGTPLIRELLKAVSQHVAANPDGDDD